MTQWTPWPDNSPWEVGYVYRDARIPHPRQCEWICIHRDKNKMRYITLKDVQGAPMVPVFIDDDTSGWKDTHFDHRPPTDAERLIAVKALMKGDDHGPQN